MESEERILEELLDLAEKGEIKYTTRQIKKFTNEKRELIYREYQAKELDQTNELIADMLIIKFEELLKSTDLIKEDSKLAKKLQDRVMFKKDVKSVVGYFTPLLPFVGLVEGLVVTSSEIIDNYNSKNKNESPTSTTKERSEPDSTERSEPEHDEG